jgi:putative endonuclease
VYILSNQSGRVLYTGVTGDLRRRLWEHRGKIADGFTRRYNINKLLYCEQTASAAAAVAREKQIKSWRREKKIALVQTANPQWRDLSEDWTA